MCLMSDFHFEDLSIINNGQHIRDTLEKGNYFHYITVFQSQRKGFLSGFPNQVLS